MVFRNDSLAVVFQLQSEIKRGGSGSEKKTISIPIKYQTTATRASWVALLFTVSTKSLGTQDAQENTPF